MAIIETDKLGKSFKVSAKTAGLRGTVSHFLRRRYRLIEAVKAVDLTVDQGEIVGFLGANGAGKTTTLKMLTGLIHPTSGKARVAGHVPFRREREFLRQITMVLGQKQQLMWDLPALDSLRINAAVYEIDTSTFRRRLDELSGMLALDTQLSQPVRKLSLGERMKVELLAALLHQPRVLFLDEPTLGLDVNAQAAVRDFLREYNRRYDATVILTSHYMADIVALCPRVVLIHKGDMIYDGSLSGILDRFAPYREIKLQFQQPPDAADLEQYGQVASVEGRAARLVVERPALTKTLTRLLREQRISDLTVNDPPVDDIVRRIFANGAAP